ncbi:MAG TPA: SIS domain-containing protein [Nocardioides sp.]|nr:SIS domain-containing protein [Nocardioides sp.]
MPEVFDDTRLDDEEALSAADPYLRPLAEAGSRVRREAGACAEALAAAVAQAGAEARPRAVVAAGPDSRLLRAVLEPWCPVPFVAWPGPGLPGWAGALDLVVVLAPDGSDTGAASAVAEAVRRGCRLVVACDPASLVGQHAVGRDTTVLPTTAGDQLASAVVVLELLAALDLGPHSSAEAVASALDEVSVACSPYRDLSVNPAKMLAIALADGSPVVWGGSVLAARAARRISEQLRRASGRAALAGDAEHLLPVLRAVRPRDLFADPFADPFADEGEGAEPRPVLLLLDDGSDDVTVREQRDRLVTEAQEHDVRVERIEAHEGDGVARYATLLATGTWAATYVQLGLGRI